MGFREEMIQVAAVAVAIVQDLDNGTTEDTWNGRGERNPHTEKVLHEVGYERSRQEIKWGPQHHTPEEWLAILAEEVGEAAQEVEVSWLGGSTMRDHLLDAERHARAFLKERFGDDPSN